MKRVGPYDLHREESEVLFMGGAMRVVGLFPLNGPLMAAERELAAQSKALTQRLGQFCPSLAAWQFRPV